MIAVCLYFVQRPCHYMYGTQFARGLAFSCHSGRFARLGADAHIQKESENCPARRVSVNYTPKGLSFFIVISYQTFSHSGRPWSMSNAMDTDSKARDITFLDTYAMARWRCVLHYMVGAGTAKGPEGEGISPDAVRILLHANLMKRDTDTDGSPVITRQGFQFLLLDVQAQVWHFMLQYLDTCETRGLNLPECLSMLFQLSFSTLGRDYSSDGLSAGLLSFLQHLREFGLVYQRKRKAGRFYPTRLALNITSRNAVATVGQEDDDYEQDRGHIVVETNYRVSLIG